MHCWTLLDKDFRTLDITEPEAQDQVWLKMSEKEVREIKKFAVAQNMTTLRNRVNELGVAEPVIQQQGENRIVVQLPGVQDTDACQGNSGYYGYPGVPSGGC